MFSEMQRAQDWTPQSDELVIRNTLEQAKIADQFGYDCWWSVEHHGAMEFSLSSTPELFNVALALNTQRIRIGHSGVLAPYKINHPIRVAERAAFVDIISNGRLELGLARSSISEWDTFDVHKELTQPQFDELATMLPAMWKNKTFSWKSELITIPEINIIPKPLQQFPRIWNMGMSTDGARTAGRLGLGFLGTTVMEPVEKTLVLKKVFRDAGAERTGTVEQPNDGFGLFTFVHCADSREEAIRSRAAEAAMWYVNRAPLFFKLPRHRLIDNIRGAACEDGKSWRQFDGSTYVPQPCDPDDPHPVIRLLNRQFLKMPIDPVEAYEVLAEVDSAIIGDPAQCLRKMGKFKEAGVDRLLCLQQFGFLDHDRVCGSIRRLGSEVRPYL
jgi:alkanesulfonate monooxygenase SsuD/methylene tetrahydromethanopterin reductase-like flavin-dependent oxidoreductase (luciferase family)